MVAGGADEGGGEVAGGGGEGVGEGLEGAAEGVHFFLLFFLVVRCVGG